MTDNSRLSEKKFRKGLVPKNFDCGITQLNKFIHEEVENFHSERLGITYLFYSNSSNNVLIGFVTISMADIKTKQLLSNDMKPIKIENYPSLQIGQLAIDKNYQGQGYGKDIIGWCLKEALEYSEEIGCRFLVLNAIPESRDFYFKCNFRDLIKQEKRIEKVMYLPIPKELFNDN